MSSASCILKLGYPIKQERLVIAGDLVLASDRNSGGKVRFINSSRIVEAESQLRSYDDIPSIMNTQRYDITVYKVYTLLSDC